jgi:hypothetical protein
MDTPIWSKAVRRKKIKFDDKNLKKNLKKRKKS